MIGTRLKDAPADIDELARILGIGLKRLRGLREKHGDGLLLHLQRQWRDYQDRPNLLHGTSEMGYTDVPALALGRPRRDVTTGLPSEGVIAPKLPSDDPGEQICSEEDLARFSAEARVNFAELRAKRRREVDPKALAARVRQVEDIARKKGIDAAPHLMRFESALRAAEAELEAAA